ncbi:MAG: hypothetical protein Q9170_003233 [Blastenia crenularia]
METEKGGSRRERKGSGRSSQPQLPPENMLVHHPAANAPFSDTRAAIARSKSRYKGARPKTPRSRSTPSVPAISVGSPANSTADTGKLRPNTTSAGFNNTLAIDDDDEPLVTLLQGRTDIQPPADHVSRPELLREARPGYGRQEPYNDPPRKQSGTFMHSEGHLSEPPKHHSHHAARAYPSSPWHTGADIACVGRNAEQEKRPTIFPIRPAMTPKKSFTKRIAGFMGQPQNTAEAKEHLKQMISHPIPIQGGDPLPVAQFDAPKSAVNSGERTVRVKYEEFQAPVSIEPSTIPADVIRLASEKMATSIDPASSVMLESFTQLGLERPLRRYEHVRDVLNSWDSDSQNTLIVEPSGTGGHDDDLDITTVPRKRPAESSFFLHHSQRPGNWDKCEVTLRSDGQMLVANARGAEGMNICHLSDFDIYIPTARQMAKKIRPPKRICFAVKSQQKSNMFMSTVNFVHFFSSNDRRMARALYTAVQEWRSWYLVNMMGRGVESRQPEKGKQGTAVGGRSNVQSRNDMFEQPQRIPKVSASAFLKPSSNTIGIAARQDPIIPTLSPARRERGYHDRQAPPASTFNDSTAGASVKAPFAEGGLLGRKYTQRKNEQRGYEVQPIDPSERWPTSSPSPVKSPVSELKRTSSQLKKPRPLIDLTPQYQEPPQHTRKGKGVTPGHVPAGGLIDIATSPEVAIQIPPTTSWRRPGASSGPEVSLSRNRSHS